MLYSNPAVFGADGALVSRYWLSVLLITAAESDERMALAGRRDLAAALIDVKRPSELSAIRDAGLRKRSVCFALTDDLVNDARDRRGRVDYDAVLRDVFFRLMQSHNELPLRWFCAPLIFRSLVKPPVQCVKVDLKDKYAVK